jgi:GMP synthase-like glutamine amidotransferase
VTCREPRALLVTHLADEGAGAFPGWLGLDLDVHAAGAAAPTPATLDPAYDALVVMGGAMGVPDVTTTHPWLGAELALLRDAVARGVPTLGVCLGAQLLAAACGGSVERGRIGPELGLRRVHLTDAAEADPLLHGLPRVAPAVQWHFDEIVTLPPGATLLASSPMYPHQAFRVGERAWGVQFHPEAGPSMVARWAREDAAALDGAAPADVAAEVERAWPDLERTWAPVARRFAAVVRETVHPYAEERR